jgi:predicted peroxiredoxin
MAKKKMVAKQKMAVVCNGDTPANIMPTLIFSTSGIALDYEVHVFVCPAGARWFVKGELEKLGTPKGMPNPVKLMNDLLDLGGEVVFCELALENKDIKPEDLRDPRIKIMKVPPYLMDVEGASQTYVF